MGEGGVKKLVKIGDVLYGRPLTLFFDFTTCFLEYGENPKFPIEIY